MKLFENLTYWAFPASFILGIVFIVGLWMGCRYYRQSAVMRRLKNPFWAVIVSLLFVTLVAIDGIWSLGLQRSWYFVLTAFVWMVLLGVTLTNTLLYNRKRVGFILNHGGLFLIMWAMFFGAPDVRNGYMIVYQNSTENCYYSEANKVMPLPFEVKLDTFAVEYYPNGVNFRQFYSHLRINDETYTVSVNSPLRYKGYDIYQSGYDTEQHRYTILQIVYDPWLWVVWGGVIMLALGALLMIFKR